MSRFERDPSRSLCCEEASSRERSSTGAALSGARSTPGRAVFASVALACSALVSSATAQAAEVKDARADYERWSPSVALQAGILRQESHGSTQSSRRPENRGGTKVFGDELLLDYYFGLSFDLMAPALADVAGRPQPFVHLDVMHPLGLEVDIAREGSPDGFIVPNFGSSDSTLPASAVGGQGMKTEAEFKSPTLTAGVGISFSFELWDRLYRIRPSVQYFYEKVEVSGVMLDADGQQVIEDFVLIEEFQLLDLSGKSNKTLHGLGGGVELEVELHRLKSGTFSIAAGFHAYHILGGRRFSFSSSDGTDYANWGATMDPLVYRGGFGFRYRFLPR